MIEFQMGDALVRVGSPEICEDCLSLNVWDGVCSDCHEDQPETGIERSHISGLGLDDMDAAEQAFAAREFGFDITVALKKMERRCALRRSSETIPYEIHEYDERGSVVAIYQQEHPNRISARHNLPQWHRGAGLYQIFEEKTPITGKVSGSQTNAQI